MKDNSIELPPLPYPQMPGNDCTASDMRAYATAAIEADRQRRGEPVAFAKDGVLFWHGEHASWRGFDGDLYLSPQPAEPVKVPRDTQEAQ